MNKLLLAIAVVSVAIPLRVPAQDVPAGASAGRWVGEWDSRGRPSGSMEMVVDVKDDTILGNVRSAGSPGCSVEWQSLEGVAKGNKVFAHYNLGGRCGKVEITYSIDQEGKVMAGSWSSEYPGYGGFRLTKQPTAVTTGVTRVAPAAAEPK